MNDVSWAPINGRREHLMASCGTDGIIIWYFVYNSDDKKQNFTVNHAIYLKETCGIRVCFNIMGNLLACTDNNNKVDVFKCKKHKEWFDLDITHINEDNI